MHIQMYSGAKQAVRGRNTPNLYAKQKTVYLTDTLSFYENDKNYALFTEPKSSIFSFTVPLIASKPGKRSFLGS